MASYCIAMAESEYFEESFNNSIIRRLTGNCAENVEKDVASD